MLISFNHIFVGIGNNGVRVVDKINIDSVIRVTINPAYYLASCKSAEYMDRTKSFFSSIPKNTMLWLIFENKPINLEIVDLIINNTPEDVIKLAYILTPEKELVKENKPKWAENFETVFYDSLWEFMSGEKTINFAFEHATYQIGNMFSKLYYYLENEMLVNIDYADLFNMIRGGNIGILRMLTNVDFNWHWGIWERGLISILVGKEVPLKYAHQILSHFQEILSERDIIWGIQVANNLEEEIEILALLTKRWFNEGGAL
ncbi:hypothetical protein [Thermococcus sp.]